MQCFEVEDEVELAHILKEAVEGLHEDLDEIKEGERRFGRGRNDDEIQGCIVAVGDERGGVVVGCGGGGRLAAVCEQRRQAGGRQMRELVFWSLRARA
jgi:hypothetical protein